MYGQMPMSISGVPNTASSAATTKIAGEGKAHAAGEGEAAHLGDGRLAEVPQVLEDGGELTAGLVKVGSGHGAWFSRRGRTSGRGVRSDEVGAGRKRFLACSGEHDDSDASRRL